VSELVDTLFDEFAAAFARGERPEVGAYVGRAGTDAGDLAALIDVFLVVAVPPPPSQTARQRVRALGPRPTLRDLRSKAGLTRDRLIDEIVATFAIAPAKRTRVKDYYRELEAGVLDPSAVSSSLWQLLGRVLGAEPSLLVDAARHQPAAERALLSAEVLTDSAPSSPANEPDDVDRLFTSGPG